jgi:hypothetical protein
MLVAGCHIDFSGLSDLFDPNPTYLDLPGRQIAAGSFYNVNVDGTDESGASVIALESHAPTTRLAIFPFAGGPGCRTGRADKPGPFPFNTRSSLPPFFPFLETPSAGRQLHFVTPRCAEPLSPIAGSNFPFHTLDDPQGSLTLTNGGDLLFLQPWLAKRTVVAQAVSETAVTDDKIWSIESGQLVVRDFKFAEVGRFGTKVTEFAVTAHAVARTAFVDGTALFVVPDKLETPEKVESDACHVGFPSGWAGFGLSYYSPCQTFSNGSRGPDDSRTLVLYGSPLASDKGPGSTDTRYVLGGNAIGNPSVGSVGDAYSAFFVTADDPKAKSGALWGAAIGVSPEQIANLPQMSGSATPIISRAGGQWQATVDVDSAGVGRLIRWKSASSVRELARGVEEIKAPLAIVNFNENSKVGDLVRVENDGVSGVLGKGIPKNGILESDADGQAAVSDSDGTVGTLIVAPSDGASFEQIAARVAVGPTHLQFIQNLHGIGYLQDFDVASGTGRLGVRVIATGDTFDVGVYASEWSEVGWPEPGLLYVVPSGQSRGIWFARLK